MDPINFEMGKFNMELAITDRGEYKGPNNSDHMYDPMIGYIKIHGESDSFNFDFEVGEKGPSLFSYKDMCYLKDWIDDYLNGKYEHVTQFSTGPYFVMRAFPNTDSKGYYFGTMEIVPILTPEDVVNGNASEVTHIMFKDNGDVARFNNYLKDAIGEYSKDFIK